jgi:hypothetical protein
MVFFFKWSAALLLTALAWLVGMYTLEYFRPYKKITLPKYR